MKKNKNLKGFICMALALVMVLGSSFAYFTDRADTSASGTAGTVGLDLTSDINLLDEDGKDILNPGDLRDGSFGVENTGNKSIDVRTTIVLTSSVPMDTEAAQAEYELYLKDDVHFVEGEGWMPNEGAQPLEVRSISEDGKTITYNIPDYILNGNEDFGDDNREIEDGITTDSHDNDFVLIFKAGSSNDFQDSVVTLDVLVEAKQHRNTGAGWDIVAQESYVSGAINQNAVLKADGSEGDIEVEVPSEPEGSGIFGLWGENYEYTPLEELIDSGLITATTEFDETEGYSYLSITAADPSLTGELVLPNCTIMHRAFMDCTGLTEVVFYEDDANPEPVLQINMGAFSGCTGLERVEILCDTFKMNSGVFSGSTNLKEIAFAALEEYVLTQTGFTPARAGIPADCVVTYDCVPK